MSFISISILHSDQLGKRCEAIFWSRRKWVLVKQIA